MVARLMVTSECHPQLSPQMPIQIGLEHSLSGHTLDAMLIMPVWGSGAAMTTSTIGATSVRPRTAKTRAVHITLPCSELRAACATNSIGILGAPSVGRFSTDDGVTLMARATSPVIADTALARMIRLPKAGPHGRQSDVIAATAAPPSTGSHRAAYTSAALVLVSPLNDGLIEVSGRDDSGSRAWNRPEPENPCGE
jgi:hypothetical protein